MVEGAYRGDSARVGWTHEADLLGGQRIDAEMLHELIATPGAQVLQAFDGAHLVGCVAVERRTGHGYIGIVTVEPGRQGGGIGASLLEAAERSLRDAGETVARMTVIAQREALIEYYGRRGYARTGETAPFPYGDARYGDPKRDDLYFVVLGKRL